MSTFTIDIQEIRKLTKIGAADFLQEQNQREQLARKKLYEAAEFRFKVILPTLLLRITKRASNEGKTFYEHIVVVSRWDKAKLNNVWYEGDLLHAKSITENSVRFGLEYQGNKEGVIKKSANIRKLKEEETEREIVWMVAKKVAKYFLEQKFEILLGQKEINITSEFQHQQSYKSSVHRLPCLRISWGH